MVIIKRIDILRRLLLLHSGQQKSIGFVPTMGALHAGHLSLITACKNENDLSVCSIFINPAQFNNKSDLAKYPVTAEADIFALETAGCDVLFMPAAEEMYPRGEAPKSYALGELEKVFEGEFRPGHFQGVARIVDKLLKAVMPDKLYLGLKDYQQCLVIRQMVKNEKHKTELRLMPTERESSGLAMSSRNTRLSADEKLRASAIHRALLEMKRLAPQDLQSAEDAAEKILLDHDLRAEYVSIADAGNLKRPGPKSSGKLVALIAAYAGEVRLIDNLLLN